MQSLKCRLALAVLGIALFAGPASAQQAPRHARQYRHSTVTYPGLVDRGGGSEAYTPQYVPAFGSIGATSGEW
jgi:hypothetical protein